jgi:hypothetical protein
MRDLYYEVKLTEENELARQVLIRAWLDSVGETSPDNFRRQVEIKEEAQNFLKSKDYEEWCDRANLNHLHLNKLYVMFKTAYDTNKLQDQNILVFVQNLFKGI